MNDEKELKKILGNLKRFVRRRGGHALAAITYPPTDEEAKEKAKDVLVAGDWTHYLTMGDVSVALWMIRHKFYDSWKEAEEIDKAILRDIKRREKAKKKESLK